MTNKNITEDSGRIRILQLASPTGLYGAERWILALIKHLDTSRFRIFVSSIKDEPGLEAPICSEAQRFGFQSHVFEFYGKLNLIAVKYLRRYIIEKRIDILHTHGYKTDLVGLIATRGTKCKIVSTPHGWTAQPDLKLRFYELLDRMSFPFFDAVVPLSDGLFKGLSSLPLMKNKVFLIENAIDISEIEAVNETADGISLLKEKGFMVIGYIGRLTQGKGLDILLNAVAEYGEPVWQIAIIGEGEEVQELNAMASKLGISDQVHFYGFRSNRLSFLKGFDIFVLPSRSEGTPRCVMEAMALGVPVVASDIPGCRHLINNLETGVLFPKDNPEKLAEAIRKVANDAILRKQLVCNGKKLVEERFSAAQMAKKYKKLFIDLLSQKLQ